MLLQQPPPDAPAPPPGDEDQDSRIKMKMICVVGSVAIAFTVFLLTVSLPISRADYRKHSSRARTEAINNVKQVNLALINFDNDYGAFPDVLTIPAVKSATSTTLALGGGSSNELLRQLIAADITSSEKIFWASTSSTPRKPNNILGTDALKKGECAFTYIAGLSFSSDPAAPLLVVPVIPGTWKFDPKPFDGKAVVLRVDGSAKAEPIDRNGQVMIGGLNIFDPRQPYWHGKAPDIKWPE